MTRLLTLAGLGLVLGCRGAPPPDAWDWALPPGFPKPVVPEDNPLTQPKVELGRHLFYDVRLSGNGAQSCASCHVQALAFTDGRVSAVGSTGEVHRRNAQSLVNVAYAPTLTWAHPSLHTLEDQLLVPLFGTEPLELGLAGKEGALLEQLRDDPRYLLLFQEAFPDEPDPFTFRSVALALACFERALVSFRSSYDRFVYWGETDALSEPAQRGLSLFLSEKTECNHCHAGFNFSDATRHDAVQVPEITFHNTGLYNEDGNGAYPATDTGLFEHTQRPQDMGRFRAPSLRNVAKTAPYMHDGSIATLDEVLNHYMAGGRARAQHGGAASPVQSEFVRGFILTPNERADLLAFLESLTDEEALRDPRFANPFEP